MIRLTYHLLGPRVKNQPRETLILMIDSYTAWSFSYAGDDLANILSSGTKDEESTEEDYSIPPSNS